MPPRGTDPRCEGRAAVKRGACARRAERPCLCACALAATCVVTAALASCASSADDTTGSDGADAGSVTADASQPPPDAGTKGRDGGKVLAPHDASSRPDVA